MGKEIEMAQKRILVVYHSQEKGNTRRMAELVAEGCRQAGGVSVETVNVNERRVDIDEAEKADAYALGSPDYFSYMAGGLKQFFDDIMLASWHGRKVLEKPYVAFATHGGGGSGIKSVENLAKATKLVQAADSVTCKGAPESDQDKEKSIQLGRSLAEFLAKRK
jgi:multimeric flavodoxin WrbA